MTRQSSPVTEPSKCRSCSQEVLWVKWPTSGKRMPVDATPDNRPASHGGGDIVLTLRGGEYGELLAEKYDPQKHEKQRNRFTSHFATCPNAGEWRRS